MIGKVGAAALLTLAMAMPAQEAAAQNPLGGALFGGGLGAIIGGVVGGGRGAAIGAAIGAASGAVIASEGQRRRGGYYYWRNGCYIQRPDGAWVPVGPEYCGPPEPGYGPPPVAVYAPPPPGAYGPPPGAYGPSPGAYGPPPGAYGPRPAPQTVYAGAPGADAVASCAQRYKSYDRASGTFLGFDGQRHPCP